MSASVVKQKLRPLLLRANPAAMLIAPPPMDGVSYHCAELYRLLRCDCIEVVRLDGDRILIIDEEGALKENPAPNFYATVEFQALWQNPNAIILGDALLCHASMLQ